MPLITVSKDPIISHCELCGAPLDADSIYGPEGFDLCREHHDLFYQAVHCLVEWSEKPAQPEPHQMSLL